jgi:hypothetical protein
MDDTKIMMSYGHRLHIKDIPYIRSGSKNLISTLENRKKIKL